jgi:hypothetical protein
MVGWIAAVSIVSDRVFLLLQFDGVQFILAPEMGRFEKLWGIGNGREGVVVFVQYTVHGRIRFIPSHCIRLGDCHALEQEGKRAIRLPDNLFFAYLGARGCGNAAVDVAIECPIRFNQ